MHTVKLAEWRRSAVERTTTLHTVTADGEIVHALTICLEATTPGELLRYKHGDILTVRGPKALERWMHEIAKLKDELNEKQLDALRAATKEAQRRMKETTQ
jgi:hypothetical protein